MIQFYSDNVTYLHNLTLSVLPHNIEITDYCDVTSPYVYRLNVLPVAKLTMSKHWREIYSFTHWIFYVYLLKVNVIKRMFMQGCKLMRYVVCDSD